jgi:hypothetical protein
MAFHFRCGRLSYTGEFMSVICQALTCRHPSEDRDDPRILGGPALSLYVACTRLGARCRGHTITRYCHPDRLDQRIQGLTVTESMLIIWTPDV